MSDKIHVEVSHRFQASAQRVYDAWLDPAKARVWQSSALRGMGLEGDIRTVEIDATVGGRFLFTDMRDGVDARHWGTYEELEPGRKIVFTWITEELEEADPIRVTMTLEPDGDGCVATIAHDMDAKWADHVQQAENGWSCMMQAADELLQGE